LERLAPPPRPLVELRDGDRHQLAAGTLLWRVHYRGGGHPTQWSDFRTWGPTNGRFDPHTLPPRDQERAVCYLAAHGPTCLAEVFQDTRVIERERDRPWLVAFRLAAPLVVLDATGTWPTRAGGGMTLHAGRRDDARLWAQAIYEDYGDLGGLRYPSSMAGNRPCFALFERAQSALPTTPELHRALGDPALLPYLRGAAKDFNYEIV
jgi:RES domain